jgi:hypothetical protein
MKLNPNTKWWLASLIVLSVVIWWLSGSFTPVKGSEPYWGIGYPSAYGYGDHSYRYWYSPSYGYGHYDYPQPPYWHSRSYGYRSYGYPYHPYCR